MQYNLIILKGLIFLWCKETSLELFSFVWQEIILWLLTDITKLSSKIIQLILIKQISQNKILINFLKLII